MSRKTCDPILDFPVRIDRNSLTLGYAGVVIRRLLFARRAEAKYGVPARESSWSWVAANWSAGRKT